jgi:Tfp pilus assembly protein PilF
MFADPRMLGPQERAGLVGELRAAAAQRPSDADLRVVLGMALCVDLQVQAAMEELREAVQLAPDSFIAQLKMGELWMRLRACDQAAAHTHEAARLAQNFAQAELARRQAATIRTMLREGIERGGYPSPFSLLLGRLRGLLVWRRKPAAVAMNMR